MFSRSPGHEVREHNRKGLKTNLAISTAVDTQARRNTEKAQRILPLYNSMKQKIADSTHSQYALQALDSLFNLGVFTSTDFRKNSEIPKQRETDKPNNR